jgi:hypothetical protein
MEGFEDYDPSSTFDLPSSDGMPPAWGEGYVPPPPPPNAAKIVSPSTTEHGNPVGGARAMAQIAPWAGTQPMLPNWQQPAMVGPPMEYGGYDQAYGPPPYAPVGEVEPPPNATPGHMLGLSLLSVTAGAAVGFHYAGVLGGFAGSLIGGALVNAYRAVSFYREGNPDADREAKISGAYAAIAAGGGGYLAYRAQTSAGGGRGGMRRNPEPEDEDDGGRETCRPRRVGL